MKFISDIIPSLIIIILKIVSNETKENKVI